MEDQRTTLKEKKEVDRVYTSIDEQLYNNTVAKF